MKILIYLLQVSACTGVFYLFYLMILSKLTFFTLNRWYLLATLILSFVIPAITIPAGSPQPLPIVYKQAVNHDLTKQIVKPVFSHQVTVPVHSNFTLTWAQLISLVYFLAMALFAAHLAVSLVKLYLRVRRNQVAGFEGVKIIKGTAPLKTGSFGSYIFLNDEGLTKEELQQVLDHEFTHVRLMHSADRMLSRLAQVILWFNPFSYLFGRAIAENHEFEVDHQVTGATDKHAYANLLLRLSVPAENTLFHPFSMIPLKKRISMLFHRPTRKVKRLLYLSALPLIVISCLAFSGRETAILPVYRALKKSAEKFAVVSRSYLEQPAIGVDLTGGKPIATKERTGEQPALVAINRDSTLRSGSTTFTRNGSEVTLTLRGGKTRMEKNGVKSGVLKMKASGVKFGVLIGSTVYDESKMDEVKQILDTLNFVGAGMGDQSISVTPGLDLSGYELIFSFELPAKSPVRLNPIRVTITGAIHTPGTEMLKPGTSIKMLLQYYGGVNRDAILSNCSIVRSNGTADKEVISFNLEKVLLGEIQEPALLDGDEVHIASVFDAMPAAGVFISGEVHHPGTYAFKENMNLQDLIDLAGGLTYLSGTATLEVTSRKTMAMMPNSDPVPTTLTSYITTNYSLLNRLPVSANDVIFINKPSGKHDIIPEQHGK